MPTFPVKGGRDRIYTALRFGRTVELVLLDQRLYRADQPCGDAQVGPPCAELEQPRNFLGPRQMDFVKKRLSSSRAAWKVLANQVMIMPTIYPGGDYIGFDSWQGYPDERRELLQHIRRSRIKDVVFVTGDIHTFVAGDVRVNDDDTVPVATEFVGGSITSPGLGEGGGGVLPGANPADPQTPESIVDLLRSTNPWAADADFDHHGYGLVTATDKSFKCTLPPRRHREAPLAHRIARPALHVPDHARAPEPARLARRLLPGGIGPLDRSPGLGVSLR